MQDVRRLAIVRAVHTAVYAVMGIAAVALLFAGVTGARGMWLWISLALLSVEGLVFALNGMRCPLTTMAHRYGARHDSTFGTFAFDDLARRAFPLLVLATAIGTLLLVMRWFDVIR